MKTVILLLLAVNVRAGDHSFSKQVNIDKLQKELDAADYAPRDIFFSSPSYKIVWRGAEAKDPTSIINAHNYVAPRAAVKFSTTSALDFGGTLAASCDTLSVTLPGCIESDVVILGGTKNLNTGTCTTTGHVSAADTVTLQRCNFGASACSNPGVENIKIVCSEN